MIVLYRPEPGDLWFRQQFMADEATMSYNAAWGGEEADGFLNKN